MRSFYCLLLLLGLTTAYAQTAIRDSGESTEETEQLQTIKEETEESEGQRRDVKPWFKQDPSRRFRHRFHPAMNGKTPCKEAEMELFKDLEEADKKEFFDIKMDDNLSLNQKKEKYTQWADKVDKETEMEKYLEKKDEWRKAKEEELETIAEKLGDKIKAVLEIVGDEDTPKKEKKEQVTEIIKDSPEGVARVLHSLFPRYASRQKRHTHHGHDIHIQHNVRHHDPHHDPYRHHGRHYRSVADEDN